MHETVAPPSRSPRRPALRLLLPLIAAALAAHVLAGCLAVVAGGAGAGTYAYLKGDLEGNLKASLEESVLAAEKAVAALKFAHVNTASDALFAEVTARDARDQKITIRLERAAERITFVKIRVGTFGDQDRSNTILANIERHL